MAFAGPLYKLVFGGSMGINPPRVETWSCSLHVAAGSAGEIAEGLVEGALSQWAKRSASNLSGEANLDYFKFNQVDPVTGRYTSAGTPLTHIMAPSVRGTGGGGPFQIACAVSWRTASDRGLGSKGRIFIPSNVTNGTNTTVSAGRWDSGVSQQCATSAAQLITDLNGALGGSCVVFSAKGQVAQEITHVNVGDVPDTQRRRRRSLKEVYATAPVS